MNQKKILIGVSVGLLLIFMTGCATDVAPKKEMYWNAFPMNPGEHDFTVLGPVEVKKEWSGTFGYSISLYGMNIDYYLFESGGVNYIDVLEAARTKYPETDAVINVNYDYHESAYFGVYAKRIDIVSGIAVKYAREQLNARVHDAIGD